MRRVAAVLPTLELTADRAGRSIGRVFGRQLQTTNQGEDSLPSRYPPGIDTEGTPTSSRRSPAGAHQVTTPVVLA